MTTSTLSERVLDRDGLQVLIDTLADAGYTVIGPTVRDEAIVYEPISEVAQLPAGWMDQQADGEYRLVRRDDEALFAHNLGPHSWKRYLFPPRRRLFATIRSHNGQLELEPGPTSPPPRYAFLGVRACELAAIRVQDRVFTEGAYVDPDYQARRQQALIIGVNCTTHASTCFCESMDTGPAITTGADLALTEIAEPGAHRFLVVAGSPRGADILAQLPGRPALPADREAAAAAATGATGQTRRMATQDLQALLQANAEHPRWDAIAERCLSCANCTMVCPTCFCTTIEDTQSLDATKSERWRQWDSCFGLEFSYIHGGSVRRQTSARYRHWLTHKLANWHDQFGQSGCVGCGRCVAWCPVGIDLVAEVDAIRATSIDHRATPKTTSLEASS